MQKRPREEGVEGGRKKKLKAVESRRVICGIWKNEGDILNGKKRRYKETNYEGFYHEGGGRGRVKE